MNEVKDSHNSFLWVPGDQRGHLKPFLTAVWYSIVSMVAAYIFLSMIQ